LALRNPSLVKRIYYWVVFIFITTNQALRFVNTQEFPALCAFPLQGLFLQEFFGSNLGNAPEVFDQALSIFCSVSFIQIFQSPARIFLTITAWKLGIPLLLLACLDRAAKAGPGLTPFIIASDAFVFLSLSPGAQITQQAAWGDTL
jgi:hypothetical protein